MRICSQWAISTFVTTFSTKMFQKSSAAELNPFPHIDAFGCLCSIWLFQNMATKEEIAQNKHFSSCHHVFNSIQLLYFHLKGVSNILFGFQSRLLHICCIWERVNKYAFKSWILYQVKNRDDRNASNLIEIKSKYLAIRNLDLTTPYKRSSWIDPILYIKMVYTIGTLDNHCFSISLIYMGYLPCYHKTIQ